MMQKRVVSQVMMALMLFCVTHVDAQQRDKYEFMRNLPVYADSLIAAPSFCQRF